MIVTPLERLRAVAAGTGALAPVSSAFGLVLDEVDPGRVGARIPWLPPTPVRGVGAVLVLADFVLTTSISTTFPAGLQLSTLTLHASELGPLPDAGATLVGTGQAVQIDGDSALGAAEITTADGRPVARISGRCAIFPVRAGWGATTGRVDAVPVGFAELRVATERADAVATTTAVAAPIYANSGGVVQGGALAAVVADALAEVIDTARPRLVGAPTELDVTFVRSVRADGATVTTRAEPVHVGSRFVSAGAELRDAAGRLCMTASAARWRA